MASGFRSVSDDRAAGLCVGSRSMFLQMLRLRALALRPGSPTMSRLAADQPRRQLRRRPLAGPHLHRYADDAVVPRSCINCGLDMQTGLPSKAQITALMSSGSSTGGLLTAGTWSTQTLATYTFSGTASSFTMTTSKGSCGVSSGALTCGSGVTASTFSAVTSGGSLLLAYSGSTAWTSDGTPSGSTVYPVYTGSARSLDYTLVIGST